MFTTYRILTSTSKYAEIIKQGNFLIECKQNSLSQNGYELLWILATGIASRYFSDYFVSRLYIYGE